MIRTPNWLRDKIARYGDRVLKDEITDEQAVANLWRDMLGTDAEFAHAVLADYVRRHLKTWLSAHRAVLGGTGPDGTADLFPDIPRTLEVAPGRFVAQAVMNRKDWQAAVKQARTKASNAGNFAEAIERTAEKVLPLLTDDELTTADVWKPEHRATEAAS